MASDYRSDHIQCVDDWNPSILEIMKLWCTEFMALDAETGEMKSWCGENVKALTREMAQQWCHENKGHLKVVGELIAEIPCKEDKPDFKNMVDYQNPHLN